eukprot:g8311.t1
MIEEGSRSSGNEDEDSDERLDNAMIWGGQHPFAAILFFVCVVFTAWVTPPVLPALPDSGPVASLGDRRVYASANRSCTPDELLPRSTPGNRSSSEWNSSVSPEWSDESTVKPVYGCDCSYTRARYFCAHLDSQGYRPWVPRAVSGGICNSVTPSQIAKEPLPPKSKMLIYGNSHLRQVVEALMCIVSDKVSLKRVTYQVESDLVTKTVVGEASCRHSTNADWKTLLDHHCLLEADESQGAGKDCSDDFGEFYMTNGAIVHYYFSGGEANKSISDALSYHNNATWSDYDAVFANGGNSPKMSRESVLSSAFELRNASVPFFWLSEYDGYGDLNRWEASDIVLFHESGARFLDVGAMARGLRSLTKGAIEEHSTSNSFQKKFGDPHFCLPGPPDEMALLLLKLVWAVHQEHVR